LLALGVCIFAAYRAVREALDARQSIQDDDPASTAELLENIKRERGPPPSR